VAVRLIDDLRFTSKIRVGKEFGGLLEIHDGKPELACFLVDTSATAHGLLELDHRLDALVEHNEIGGPGIDARG
jgi:hypothetical protein